MDDWVDGRRLWQRRNSSENRFRTVSGRLYSFLQSREWDHLVLSFACQFDDDVVLLRLFMTSESTLKPQIWSTYSFLQVVWKDIRWRSAPSAPTTSLFGKQQARYIYLLRIIVQCTTSKPTRAKGINNDASNRPPNTISVSQSLWPWPLTSWPTKLSFSCPCPADQLCQFASKWVHWFSKYHAHKLGNERRNSLLQSPWIRRLCLINICGY